ncbi:DUF948 domain-containing protein [Galactobacter caseinivorans]|uniref:DUF948 domain-containing protein n=1 Tax=Galactobacter caseinivorans TaxID=2676123 RepID=A0A496PL05_9MICC|nr:DUF948 domain-containing protein [Galactobacter caseinivorans]RKW71202.1 DUF948 domain-containing protein [Galactobacter caseinivorans]
MSGADIAGLIAAGVFLLLVLLLAVPILKLGKVFDELRRAVREVTESTTPILGEVSTTVASSHQQLERVDAITSNVQDATANLTAVSSLTAAVLGKPLIKIASFSAGVRAVFSSSSRTKDRRTR